MPADGYVSELSVLEFNGKETVLQMEIFWGSPPFYIAGCRDKTLSLTISLIG